MNLNPTGEYNMVSNRVNNNQYKTFPSFKMKVSESVVNFRNVQNLKTMWQNDAHKQTRIKTNVRFYDASTRNQTSRVT